jgi:DNA-binding transcriptional LysR family regulator
MRFDLVDLQLFVAIAEADSITHGAAKAHLALASASARIKALEATLGVGLLTRGRRGIVLTAAGEALLGHARIVLQDIETMRGDLGGYARGLKASVSLLANTVGLSEHLPKALASFLRAHSNISLAVEERESADIAQAIASGAADIGFAADHTLPDHLERFSFCEDRFMLVVSPRSAFASRRQIDFQDVVQEDFIGLTNSTALQSHIGKYAARLGARLRFRAQLRDFDAMCQMVAAGVGIAIVPEVAARRCARSMSIRLVRIRDPWASRQMAICVRSFKALSRPAQQLCEHLRSEAVPSSAGKRDPSG